MKKRLVLGILPALLILSACNGVAQQKEENDNLFLEDTLAHEEIFGGSQLEERALQPRRAADPEIDPVEKPESAYSIGVQSFVSGDYVSFRFVVAVTFGEGQLDPTKAVWTRTITRDDGDVRKAKGNYECETAYTRISSGGSSYSIANFNTDNSTAHTHFVVYTIRNVPIPGEGDHDYYVGAYLTLSGEGGVNKVSKAIAINASQTEKYVYVHNQGKYFITGSFSSDPIEPTAVRNGTNIAEFESGLNLNPDDTLVIKEFYDSEFIIHGASQLIGPKGSYYFENADGKIKAKYKGSYKLYFKYEDDTNKIFVEAANVSRPVRIKLADSASAWNTSNQIVIYAFGGENEVNKKWFATKSISGGFETLQPIDPTLYQTVKIVEINSGAALDWANKAGDHETDNLSYPNVPNFEGDNVQDTVFAWHREWDGAKNWWGSSWGVF